jgi:hypothetical protein
VEGVQTPATAGFWVNKAAILFKIPLAPFFKGGIKATSSCPYLFCSSFFQKLDSFLFTQAFSKGLMFPL